MKRKLLAILLACIMTAALLPVPALAEDGQPEESHHEHSYAVTQTAEPTCTEQG